MHATDEDQYCKKSPECHFGFRQSTYKPQVAGIGEIHILSWYNSPFDYLMRKLFILYHQYFILNVFKKCHLIRVKFIETTDEGHISPFCFNLLKCTLVTLKKLSSSSTVYTLIQLDTVYINTIPLLVSKTE